MCSLGANEALKAECRSVAWQLAVDIAYSWAFPAHLNASIAISSILARLCHLIADGKESIFEMTGR